LIGGLAMKEVSKAESRIKVRGVVLSDAQAQVVLDNLSFALSHLKINLELYERARSDVYLEARRREIQEVKDVINLVSNSSN